MNITDVHARQILDCKARPMVEVKVTLEDGTVGRGAGPTGTTVGAHEASVLRDHDFSHYNGLGVQKAVANVNGPIADALRTMPIEDQSALDEAMIALDGSPDKGRLGGNAIYSASIACFRAQAASQKTPLYALIAGDTVNRLPVPCFNVVNGGRYDEFTQPFNEFLVVPSGAESVEHAIEIGVRLFHQIGLEMTKATKAPPRVATSYGHAAPYADPAAVLDLMRTAAVACQVDNYIAYALDCASSEMYDSKSATYELNGRRVSADDLIESVAHLSQEFDLVFVEDLLDEDDWEGYVRARRELSRTLLLGDDLIVSDRKRLQQAIAMKAVDGFVLKPNQVGTISEALDTHAEATQHGLISVPSGRSGGVIDDIVMDLSVGLGVPFQKNGAPRSGERIEKLNFLLRVIDENPGCRMTDLADVVRY
ncbi:enolase [Agreia sp. VKM Ac-1783]|nr:enolase C-terminal domain-like protein [Agreia sp. VKM Ac-1783]SMQ74224.1 enolase [Agreia sp. VKM Ac-1783]